MNATSPPRWDDLPGRLMMGSCGLGLLVLLVIFGSPAGLAVVSVLAAIGAGMEFRRLLTPVAWRGRTIAGGAGAGLAGLVALLRPPLDSPAALGAEFVILVSIAVALWLYEVLDSRVHGEGNGTASLLEWFLLALVAGLLPVMPALIRRDGGEPAVTWTLLALAVSWGGDIGGYFIGRRFGRHAMAPKLSPRKTWEGAAGSVLCAFVASGLVLVLSPRRLPLGPPQLVAVILVGNILAQCGDLAESWVKRRAGVRHSGLWGSGSGGWLDTLDSVSFAAPILYMVMRLAGR